MGEYGLDQFSLVCNLLHQAICEQRLEPDFDAIEAGERFTGQVERDFAVAILDGVLGLESPLKCRDCRGEPEMYMVTDEVWAAAGLAYDDGWVCVACLSNRLGRELQPDDFTVAIQ